MKIFDSVVVMLAAGTMLISTGRLGAQDQDSGTVSALLQHAREHAATANHNAELIDSFRISNTSWKSHSFELAMMKECASELSRDAAELTAIRARGLSWQQEVIDGVVPLLRLMSERLSTMVRYQSANQNRVHTQEYEDYIKANNELSRKLLAMIDDSIDYAEAKANVEDIERKLRLFP